MDGNKGFTLIEMIMVVVILGILFVVPNIKRDYKKKEAIESNQKVEKVVLEEKQLGGELILKFIDGSIKKLNIPSIAELDSNICNLPSGNTIKGSYGDSTITYKTDFITSCEIKKIFSPQTKEITEEITEKQKEFYGW